MIRIFLLKVSGQQSEEAIEIGITERESGLMIRPEYALRE
jgi:hypothetical protein